jgi:membrane protein YdbS with pleckstrin-like domain
MKTYSTPFVRWLGSFMTMSLWIGVVGGGWYLLWTLIDKEKPQLYVGFALIGGLGSLFVMSGLALLRNRCEIGAREVVLHQGFLWQSTTTLPIVSLSPIEVSSGPLMRLFGLADLTLAGQKVYGIPKAEEVKAYLTARREALQESARSGEIEVGTGTAELVQERLARAIERLEGRLPRG